jgi:hypothetical protein
VADELEDGSDGAAVGRDVEAGRRLAEAGVEPVVEAHLHRVGALDLAGDKEVIGGAEAGVEGDLGAEALDRVLRGTVVAGAVVDLLADRLPCLAPKTAMGQTYIRDNQGVKPADLREDSVTGLDGPLGRAAPELRGLRHRPSLGRLPVLACSVNLTRSNILGQIGISPGIFRILVLSGNALSVWQSLLAQSLMSYREAAKLVVLVLGVVVDRIGVTI